MKMDKSNWMNCIDMEGLDIARENLDNTQYNKLLIAMESDKSKLSVGINILNTVMQNVWTKIYDTNNKRYNEELFYIRKSNGSIDNVEGIKVTFEVLKVLGKSKDKKTLHEVEKVNRLISHIRKRENKWKKIQHLSKKEGFSKDGVMAGIVYYFYCALVRVVIARTSVIAAQSTGVTKEYVSPGLRNTLVLSSGYMDKLLKSIEENKRLDKIIEYCLSTKEKNKVEEAAIVITLTIGLIFLMVSFVLSIRLLVYFFYTTTVRIADYFAQQAAFLRIHAAEVKKSKLDKASTDSIIAEQKVWAERFTSLSEFFMVDELKVSKKIKSDIKDSNKQINPIDVIDTPNDGLNTDFI